MTTKYLDNSSSVLLSTEIGTLDEQVPAVSETARDFDFHAVHNGEACIESFDPKDRGTERQFRFTRALLCTLLGVKSVNTIDSHVQALINRGVIDNVKNLTLYQSQHGLPTTLYDLKVFNYLVMRLDTDQAWEKKAKFNDVLVERETGVTQAQNQAVMLPNFCNPAEAARAWADLYEKNQAIERRAMTAEAERDEAIRTKTQYQSNLASQMSGRVGGLTAALNRVKLENDRLKGDRLTKEDVYIIMDTQGVTFTLKTVKDVIRDELNIISEYLKEPFPKIPTGERTDPNGKTFEVKSFVYTRKSVRVFFEFVENHPMEWQARNRKSILSEWLNHHMTIPA